MDFQGTSPKAKTILKKTKLEVSHFLISKFTAKFQQSKECGTGLKTDTKTNGSELRA